MLNSSLHLMGASLTNVIFSNWDNLVLIEITELNNLDIKDIYFGKRLPSAVINLENNYNSGLSEYDTNHDDIICNSNGNDEYEDGKKFAVLWNKKLKVIYYGNKNTGKNVNRILWLSKIYGSCSHSTPIL